MYFLAVDGGGTKTLAMVADAEGNVIGCGRRGGSNPNFVGKEQAVAAVRAAIAEACGGLERHKLAGAAICVPNIEFCGDEWLAAEGIPASRASFDNDVMSTFCGAIGAESGVVALAGTGSFAFGIHPSGERLMAGGWGPIVGDGGSGQQIGAEALRAVTRHADGMGPATALTARVLRHFGFDAPEQLRCVIPVDHVAKLAPLVAACAAEGDPVAGGIIAGEAEKLAALAVRVVTGLGMDDARYALAVAGGIANFGRLLLDPFTAKLRSACPHIRIERPLLPPIGGAMLLAYRKAGIAWTDERKRRLVRTIAAHV
jgi:N-acetylglucosamine kinase-like BadF-type ATPase